VLVNGDGETSRDFCFVENAVQANLLAGANMPEKGFEVYNVAVNARTSLNELFAYLSATLGANGIQYDKKPVYRDFRQGDVRHSQADIGKAQTQLGYAPSHTILQGIETAMPWYIQFLK